MIEIKNLNKYFNKGRKNEIHVIDNTSLTLPDKGLVNDYVEFYFFTIVVVDIYLSV